MMAVQKRCAATMNQSPLSSTCPKNEEQVRRLWSLMGEARKTVKGTPDDRGSKTTVFEIVMDRVSDE